MGRAGVEGGVRRERGRTGQRVGYRGARRSQVAWPMLVLGVVLERSDGAARVGGVKKVNNVGRKGRGEQSGEDVEGGTNGEEAGRWSQEKRAKSEGGGGGRGGWYATVEWMGRMDGGTKKTAIAVPMYRWAAASAAAAHTGASCLCPALGGQFLRADLHAGKHTQRPLPAPKAKPSGTRRQRHAGGRARARHHRGRACLCVNAQGILHPPPPRA